MKNIMAVIFFIMFFFIGCGDKAKIENLEKENANLKATIKHMKAQAEIEKQNEELIRNLYKEWNKRNVATIKEFYSPDVKFYHASVETHMVLDKAIEMIKASWKAFPDLTISIKELIPKGDKVMVRFIGQGTNTGKLGSMPATGNRCIAEAVEIFHIEGGKIVENWELSDRLGLMQQLGLELKPK